MATVQDVKREIARRALEEKRAALGKDPGGPTTGLGGGVSGVVRGMLRYPAAPVSVLAEGVNAAAGTMGYDPPLSPDPVMAVANRLNIGRPGVTPAAQAGQRIGEPVGMSLLPAGILGAVGRPAAAGMEAASGLGSGIGAEVGRGYGGDTGALLGGIAGSLAPSGFAGALKGTVRGGGAGGRDMAGVVEDFSQIGVSPTVAQASGNRGAQVLESTLSRVPGSQAKMAAQADNVLSAVQTRVQSLAQRLSPDADDAVSVGLKVRGGLAGRGGFVERFKTRGGELYRQVDDLVPRDAPVEMTQTKAVMDDIGEIVSGSDPASKMMKAYQKPLLRTLNEALEGGTVSPYERVRRFRSMIGRELSAFELTPDVPRAELKRLYAALSDDMSETISAIGPEAAKRQARADRYWKAGIKQVDNFIEPLVNKRTGEEVIAALDSASRKGTTTLKTIFRSLKPDEQNAISGYVVEQMGRATSGRQTAAGDVFSLETFLTNYDRYNKTGAAKVLFRGATKRELDRLLRVAEKMRESGASLVRAGTAPTGASTMNTATLLGGMAGLSYAPVETMSTIAAAMAGTRGAAQFMTSPTIVRWLSRGMEIPITQMPAHLDRLDQMLGRREQTAGAP